MVLPALQLLKTQTVPVFRRMQSGTPFQALPRLGTATTGLHQMQELTTQLQAPQNAVLNATQTTIGTALHASQPLKTQTAQPYRQMLFGTRFQA